MASRTITTTLKLPNDAVWPYGVLRVRPIDDTFTLSPDAHYPIRDLEFVADADGALSFSLASGTNVEYEVKLPDGQVFTIVVPDGAATTLEVLRAAYSGLPATVDNFETLLEGLLDNADVAANIDHTEISNIGTNSHAQIDTHIASTANPHAVTKAQVGLGNVPDVDARARSTHTGTQLASTISDFATAADALQDIDPPLVIASGTVTLPTINPNVAVTNLVVETEGGAASDDITAISGGSPPNGMVLIIRTTVHERDVTIKNTVSILLDGDRDCTLATSEDRLILQHWFGNNWVELARSHSSHVEAPHDHSTPEKGGQLTDAALSAAVGIAKGGTGQTSQTAAFDALAPTTTKGDVIAHDGTDNVRLAVGTDGQVLVADSAQAAGVKWAAAGAGSAIVVQEGDATVDAAAGTLDFNAADFDVTSSPAGEANIALSGAAKGRPLLYNQPFAGSSGHTVNDVFSATYANYEIEVNIDSQDTAGAHLYMRFRVSGADDAGASDYAYQQFGFNSAASAISGSTGAAQMLLFGGVGGGTNTDVSGTVKVRQPFSASTRAAIGSHFDGLRSGVDWASYVGGAGRLIDKSFTGFSILPSSGLFSGSVRVYGMGGA